MKRFPECAWCLHFEEDENLEPIGCKLSQIKFAFNEMLMALPILCLFAEQYPSCKVFEKNVNEFR